MEFLLQLSGIIKFGGVILILLLVFAETGLLLGLVIPGGETLIFTSGLLVSTGTIQINIVLLLALLIVFSFLGDCSGYFIGKKLGPKLYHKKDNWYFKKKYLEITESYLQKHKRKAIIMGKFLPIIRPFMPILSGVSKVKTTFFMLYAVIAVVVYQSAFLLAGYFLGNAFPAIKQYLAWILPISILVLLIPVLLQIKKHKAQTSAKPQN
jgi:membrane-associated protein